jgi:hypothetical protein
VALFDGDWTSMTSSPFSKPPRRDGMALGFGIAFIAFGVLGLLRSAGLRVDTGWLYSLILVGLGVAGLSSALLRERQ